MKKTVSSKIFLIGFVCLGTILLSVELSKNTFENNLSVGDAKWVHYAKREATSSQDGIREYWVKCGGQYQFNKPGGVSISEASSYDTSGFSANDPRYIKYISDSKNAFYSTSDSSYNFDEIGISGYVASSTPSSTLGETERFEFYKSDSSPMYSINCTTVTDVIASKDDLAALQKNIETANQDGYYVLTADLDNPTSYVNVNGLTDIEKGSFLGTFDGRNHTINNPVYWGYRMFGNLKGATIKNLNFANVSVFGLVASYMTDALIENINVTMAETINKWSNVGMLSDNIYGSTKFKDCSIDYGEHYHLYPSGGHETAIFGNSNWTNKDNQTFENVTVRCLPSVKMFLSDYYGRSLRPTDGITYTSTCYFIKNGTLNYSIKYLEGNSVLKEAATYIQSTIKSITGKTIPMSSFSETQEFSIDSTYIILGSDVTATNAYITPPSSEGEYFVKSVGKAVLINAYDDSAWQPAALKFLLAAFGFENIGGRNLNGNKSISINTVKDVKNIDSFFINIQKVTPFTYRQADWAEPYHSDTYADGYNVIAYSNTRLFMSVPGCSDDPHLSGDETYHTILRILYPGTYSSTHAKWFATNNSGELFPKSDNSYWSWQPCFTAHGDTAEYESMVQTTIDNSIAVINRSENLNYKNLMLGLGDNYQYCHCSACAAKEAEYGSRSGACINFFNDVCEGINARVAETGRDEIIVSCMAYCSYKDAPVKNGNPTITCTDKLRILLAPIEANFTHPINDDTYNSEAHTLIEEWSLVGKLYMWLYETNFSHYLYPYNSHEAMSKSIAYLATKNVSLAYIEGQHNCRPQRRTGFDQLKKYIDGKYMIDPEQNYDDLVYKFFVNYYGPGFEYMRTFYKELTDRMGQFDTNSTYKKILYRNGNVNSIYSDINSAGLWDRSQLERWVALTESAMAETTDAEIIDHCKTESLFPRFALCRLFDSYYSSSELLKMRKTFKEYADSLDVTLTSEGNTTKLSDIYASWGIA